MDGQTLARGLGWFSIGLGLYEAAAPGHLASWLGIEKQAPLLGTYGYRELTAGLGILDDKKPAAGWLWARVGGDILDLATLGAALGADNPKRANVGIAIGAVVGVTVLDVLCGQQLSKQ